MSSSHHRRSRETSHAEMPIGRYTRLDEIGRGSFATVYQGVHTVSLELLRFIRSIQVELYGANAKYFGVSRNHVLTSPSSPSTSPN